jgi:hypothetical protein
VVENKLKSLIYQRFDADGSKAFSKENQSNDAGYEQTNEVIVQAP